MTIDGGLLRKNFSFNLLFFPLEERMGLIRSDLLDLDIADLFEIPPGEIKFDDFAKNKNI